MVDKEIPQWNRDALVDIIRGYSSAVAKIADDVENGKTTCDEGIVFIQKQSTILNGVGRF